MALSVPTPDGRTLEVLLDGPDDGIPLVVHHGTPTGAVPDASMAAAASGQGIRTISYSRPGYGDSTPRVNGATTATVADDAADVATILDHLGIDEFVTLGWSGGGPRSLACAALLAPRCRGAVCGVGLAPPAEFDGDITAGMGGENVEEFAAAFAGEGPLTAWLEKNAPATFAVTGPQVADVLGSLVPPVDRAALTAEHAERAAAGFRHAGKQGIVGWLHDDLAMVRPWGFSVRDITVPVAVWQGTADMMVPHAHASWIAEHVPGARLHLEEGEGHISLRDQMPRILGDLLDISGLR
jgi:pimeloyl-ACP methyl ester carboxylesterase